MKNKFTVAIPPKGCCDYLTAGKEYEITVQYNALGVKFGIISDNNYFLLCVKDNCAHLKGGNWTLK